MSAKRGSPEHDASSGSENEPPVTAGEVGNGPQSGSGRVSPGADVPHVRVNDIRKMRDRSEAAAQQVSALRRQLAESAAHLAATGEEIARAQETLISHRPAYAPEHQAAAASARKAARRAREIEEQFKR
jgi:hypothetical protein